jgi:serine phosphatase RsbU (regulator of sigma subunit)/Tfp pilus assembly protein PilF
MTVVIASHFRLPKVPKKYFCLVFLFCSLGSYSQKPAADSLLLVLKNTKPPCPESCPEDTLLMKTLNALGKAYIGSADFNKALEYCTKANELGKKLVQLDIPGMKIPARKALASSYSSLGSIYNNRGEYTKAFKNHTLALNLREEIGDRKGIADSHNNIGNCFWYQGNYAKALENYLQSLKIREEIGDKGGIETSLSNIGMMYKNQNDYEKALEVYLKALAMSQELNDRKGMATCYHNIGNIYVVQSEEEVSPKIREDLQQKALSSHLQSLAISNKIGDKQGLAEAYFILGSDYRSIGTRTLDVTNREELFLKGLQSSKKAIELSLETGSRRTEANASATVGIILANQNKMEEGSVYLAKALSIFRTINFREGVKNVYGALSELYENKKDFKMALSYQRMFSQLRDSLLNEQNSRQMTEMNSIYESEKKDKEIVLLNKDNEKRMEEGKKQKQIITIGSVGLLLVLVFAIFSFISYRQKRQANVTITRQKEEVEKKNEIIQDQKRIMEEKNKDITDSINYARLIQEAILTSKELKYKLFPEAFVLFQPRDIVSGDFYWFSEKDGKKLIAAVDCTGHGVPGAFMSMIGNAFLNEILNEKGVTIPEEILSELRHRVIRALRQTGSAAQSQDGMDIALLAFNAQNTQVNYSGANNPLWIFRKNGTATEMLEFAPNKRPIGYYLGKSLPFMGHQVPLQKGDTLYIFTDGYADQFGGEKGKKFKAKALKELLLRIQDKTMIEQETILAETFKNWKGDQPQVDDVLIIGIRV